MYHFILDISLKNSNNEITIHPIDFFHHSETLDQFTIISKTSRAIKPLKLSNKLTIHNIELINVSHYKMFKKGELTTLVNSN